MRLFSALPLAPACVDQLTRLRLRWSAPGDGLRWSEPEQWHITLRFFGDVDDGQARCLEESLRGLTAPAPELVLGGLDLFAAKGILFAFMLPSPALLNLHTEVTAFAAACGAASESRPFQPHVTLARSKGRSGYGSLQRLTRSGLPALGPEIRWIAEECLLLESYLRPHGAEYTVRSRVILGRKPVTSGEHE